MHNSVRFAQDASISEPIVSINASYSRDAPQQIRRQIELLGQAEAPVTARNGADTMRSGHSEALRLAGFLNTSHRTEGVHVYDGRYRQLRSAGGGQGPSYPAGSPHVSGLSVEQLRPQDQEPMYGREPSPYHAEFVKSGSYQLLHGNASPVTLTTATGPQMYHAIRSKSGLSRSSGRSRPDSANDAKKNTN